MPNATVQHRVLDVDPRTIPGRVAAAVELAADEAEAQRRLPAGLLEELRAAGAFRLLTPVELGGFECDLRTELEVIEAFGRLDGSVAWNVWNGNLGFSGALLDARGTSMVWETPDPVIANSARVTGGAVPHDGGFRLSGRWDIVSAIDAADWVALFGVVLDGDQPVFVAPGVPDVRAFFLRRSEITVLDTWDVSAMRGTGSNTVIVEGAFVDASLAPSPSAPGTIDRPLYRIPAFTLASTGCAAAVLGMAQASIDAVVALAMSKPTDNGQTLRERAHAQAGVASAEAALRAARLLLHAAADDVMAAATAGRPVDEAVRAPLRAAMVHAGQTARRVAMGMYELGSSASLYRGGRLDRIFRDTCAATQHALLQATHYEPAGRVRLGLPAGVSVL